MDNVTPLDSNGIDAAIKMLSETRGELATFMVIAKRKDGNVAVLKSRMTIEEESYLVVSAQHQMLMRMGPR